jgi:hypothetical protein
MGRLDTLWIPVAAIIITQSAPTAELLPNFAPRQLREFSGLWNVKWRVRSQDTGWKYMSVATGVFLEQTIDSRARD